MTDGAASAPVLVHDAALRARIARNLTGFERRPIEQPALVRAAVAIAILADSSGAAAFVLTRRAAGLNRHGGQFALPGGRMDPGETPEAAAARELEEEVGLARAHVEVLGALDDFETRSGFSITPVVAWIAEPQELAPDPREVAWASMLPLTDLLRPDAPVLGRIPESERTLIAMPLAGTLVHAPTAAILFQLREVALLGRATRVYEFEQPTFAWR